MYLWYAKTNRWLIVIRRKEAGGACSRLLRQDDLLHHNNTMTTQKATFAAGCFWGVEATFQQIVGVISTVVGYTGGTFPHPTYEDVCTGDTGHAEAIEITYDPSLVSYETLLDVFWRSHDPTTRNRQGPDVGTQYRSAIFFHTPEQEMAARASKERVDHSGRYHRPVVTEITPVSVFYRAEEYHQRYFEKRGTRCTTPSKRLFV